MSHVTPEELDVSLRRVKKYIDDNTGSGSGGSIHVDSSLSDTSEDPVQNKVIKAALDDKADIVDIPDAANDAEIEAIIADVFGS